MQWGVKLLCKHPLVQHKLRAELLNNLPGLETRPPTYAEISDESKVPYLTAVIHEILRCSRTASAVSRDTTCDTVLLGYPIPKGTQVLIPIGMVQQLESDGSKDVADGLDTVRSASSQRGRKTGYWSSSDVHLFNPERWLTPDGSFDANAGPYMPFSFGFRGCFGQKLAVSPSDPMCSAFSSNNSSFFSAHRAASVYRDDATQLFLRRNSSGIEYMAGA
jgi:hypothetical protein